MEQPMGQCHLYKEREGIPFDVFTQTVKVNRANCEGWTGEKCRREREL
jgi:hypothetical protein